MKLGFVSAILAEIALPDVLQFAGASGYSCVELMCWPISKAERRYAGVTHVSVAEFDQSQADDLKGLATEHGVEVSALGYYPNPLAPDAEESQAAVAHIKKVIEASSLLGLDMNTFVGRDWTKSVDDNWARFLEVWQPIIAFAEDHGVKVGIENCPMIFSADEWPGGKNLATTPAIWDRMFNDIPSENFGLNYDPSHMVWQHMDYIQPIKDYADKFFHVHAKDVRIDKDRLDQVGIMAYPSDYHTPKLPGLGEVDWGRFCSVLGDCGYDGPVCVEVEDRAYEGSIELRKDSLTQSHTYLRNFISG